MDGHPQVLTVKQERWVQYYLAEHYNPALDGKDQLCTLYNQTQAAIAAGYTGGYHGAAKQGYINIRHPKIIRRLRERAKQMFGTIELTIDRVLVELEEIRVHAMQARKYGVALRAVEHKGRYLKMFVDRIEHLHTVEDASSKELTELLGALLGKIPEIPKSFDDLMAAIGGVDNTYIAGQSDSGPGTTAGDGQPAGRSDADSPGTLPAD